jgi:hypothetical protein
VILSRGVKARHEEQLEEPRQFVGADAVTTIPDVDRGLDSAALCARGMRAL